MTSITRQSSLWTCDDGSIRVTAAGQPSVFDMIKVLGGQKNPRRAWADLIETHPEVVDWVGLYKFPGRGQRYTPILSAIEKAEELVAMAKLWTTHEPTTFNNLIYPRALTERNLQQVIVDYLKECGEHPQEYVRCTAGIADIVTTYTVIEVKCVSLWKAAIGQALVYSRVFQLFPEVALYGRGNFPLVLETCTSMGIACSCYPSDSSLTAGMLKGLGAPTYDNLDDIGHGLKTARMAVLN